ALRDFLQNKYSSSQNCVVQDLVQHEHSKLKATSNRSLKITHVQHEHSNRKSTSNKSLKISHGEVAIDRKSIFQAHAALITPVEQVNNRSLKITHSDVVIDRKSIFQAHAALITPLEQNIGESVIYQSVEALREFLQDKYVSSNNFNLVEDVEDSNSTKLSNTNSLKITLVRVLFTNGQNCVVQNLGQHEHSNRKSTSNKSLKISHGEVVIDRKSIFQAHAALITPVEQVNQNCVVQDLVQHEHSNRKSTSNKSLKISHGEVAIDRKSIFQAHAALITPVEQYREYMLVLCFMENIGESVIYQWVEALREFLQDKYVSSNNFELMEDVEDSCSTKLSNTNSLKNTLVRELFTNGQNCVVQDLVQHGHSNRKTTSNKSLKITHGEVLIDRKSIFQAHAALITPVEQIKNKSLKITHGEVVIDRKSIFQAHAALITPVEQVNNKSLKITHGEVVIDRKSIFQAHAALITPVEQVKDFLQNKYSSSQNCVVQDLVQHEHSYRKSTSNRSLKITHGEVVIDRKSIFQAHAALITPVEQVEALREFLQDKYVSSNNFELMEDVEDSSSTKLSNTNSLKITLVEALRDFLQNKYSSGQNCVVQDLVQHEHSYRKSTSNKSLKITHGEVVIDRKSIFRAHAALITPVEQVNQNCVVQDLVQHEHSNRKSTSNKSLKITHGEVVIDRKSIFQAHAALITPVEQVNQNCVVQDLVHYEHSNRKTTSNRSLKITHGEVVIDRKSIFQAHAALITPLEQVNNRSLKITHSDVVIDRKSIFQAHAALITPLEQNIGESVIYQSVEALREFLQDKYVSSNNFNLVEDVEDSNSTKLSNTNSLKITLVRVLFTNGQNCVVQNLVQHEHSNRKSTSNKSLKISHGEVVIDRKSIFQAHAALITPVEQVNQNCVVQDLVQHEHSNRKSTSNKSLKISHGEVAIDRKSIFQAHAALITPVEQVNQNCVVQNLVQHEHSNRKSTSNKSLKISHGEVVIDRKSIFQAHAALITPVEQVNQNCVVQDLVQHEHSNRKSTSNKSLKISHGEVAIDRKSIFQAHAALITPVEQVNQNCVVQDLVQHEHSNRKSTSNKSLKITHGEVVIDRKSIFQAHAALITPVEQVNQNCVVQNLGQHEHSNRKSTSNKSLKISHGEVAIDRKSIFQAHAALITPVEQVNQNCVVQDLVQHEHSNRKSTSNKSLKISHGEVAIDRKSIFQAHAALITPVEQVNQNCVVQDLVQHELSNRKTTSNRSLKITHGELVIDRKSIFQVHAALITPVEQVNQNCVLQDLVQHEHSNRKTTSNTSLKITHGEVVIDRKSIFQAHAALITPVEQVNQNCVVQDLVQHEHSNRKTTSNKSLKITHGEVVIDRKSIFQAHAALITPVEQVK
ncbi:hypothetical protein J6590_102168, partial [Homalodisca vitripennis]